jgi:hypothetical protein
MVNATFDQITFNSYTYQPLFETHFYYSSFMLEHSRTFRTWIDVVSDLGGLKEIIFSLMNLIFGFVNERLKNATLVTSSFTSSEDAEIKKPFARKRFGLTCSNVFNYFRKPFGLH